MYVIYNSIVSIQPLLLFDTEKPEKGHLLFKFQYNPCYCSIECYGMFNHTQRQFQYNPCYCSMPQNKPFFKSIIHLYPSKIKHFLLFYQPQPIFSVSPSNPLQSLVFLDLPALSPIIHLVKSTLPFYLQIRFFAQ